MAAGAPAAPDDVAELEERLSRPTDAVLAALARCPGDVVVLGAGGKMGPSLTRMLARAATTLGDERTIHAVSRFTNPAAARLAAGGNVSIIPGDLGDPATVAALPDAPNVVFMAGRKFGTTGGAALTWHANTVVPAMVAARYPGARVVAFSTGNVYGLTPVGGPGSAETDPVRPVGEYAASCVGRERVFECASEADGTRVALIRLNYAVDLRYGVLVDIADRVRRGDPVDLRMGHVNCIWQGDATAIAIACLAHAEAPPFVLNVTGADTLSVRHLAEEFGRCFGRPPVLVGEESPDALLSDTSHMRDLFGAPAVDSRTLAAWVADWMRRGGATSGAPTHFEEREGAF